ncbi:hypothetical protein LINPERHAP1_LOCUS12493 [Linum perenne]
MIPGVPHWDEELIYDTFEEADAAAILELPLPNINKPDERIWHYEKNGVYSLKEKVVAILWSIWKERNSRVWKNETTVASWVVKLGLDTLHEWQDVRRKTSSTMTSEPRHCTQWYPPKPGELKCNIDVAVFESEGRTGMGVVVRDERGRVVKFRMQSRAGVGVPKEGEGMALLEAPMEMEIEGMDVVSFETDAQTVVTALQSDVDDRSEFGDIIQRCKDVLAGQVHFSVQFARRSQNRVAHDIARRSCSNEK